MEHIIAAAAATVPVCFLIPPHANISPSCLVLIGGSKKKQRQRSTNPGRNT